MKMLIELWLDGYNSEAERRQACIEFVQEQLDFSASGVKILWAEEAEDPPKKGNL